MNCGQGAVLAGVHLCGVCVAVRVHVHVCVSLMRAKDTG